jgi:outer membrane protein assembly factor BamE
LGLEGSRCIQRNGNLGYDSSRQFFTRDGVLPADAKQMRTILNLRIPAFLLAGLLAGCSLGLDKPLLLPGITPYRIDIQQGNYVTLDMLAKLKPGMTRSQVRYVMGTPLIVDAFHQNRWDYVYNYRKAGELTEQRVVTMVFEGDRLARIEGDVVAAKGGDGKAMAEKPVAVKPPAAPVPATPAGKPEESRREGGAS